MTIDAVTVFGFWPLRNCDVTVETLLGLMKRHGVDRACAMSLKGPMYHPAEGNEETLRICGEHPELIPVGYVDPQQYTECLPQVDRCLAAGIRLFRFFPEQLGGFSADRPASQRVLRFLADRGVATIVSAAAGLGALMTAYGGSGAPLILTHVNYGNLADVLALTEAHTNVYVTTFCLNSPGAVDLVADTAGPERVLFGSGAPLHYMAGPLKIIQEAHVSQEAKARMAGGNIEAMIGLGEA